MSTNKQEQSNTLTSVKSQDKQNWDSKDGNTEIVEREPVEGTPFWLTGSEEKGYFLNMARWRITPIVKTKEEVLKYAEENMYNVILTMILSVVGTEQAETKLDNNKNQN